MTDIFIVLLKTSKQIIIESYLMNIFLVFFLSVYHIFKLENLSILLYVYDFYALLSGELVCLFICDKE